ncbi:hypothetical protein GCM10010149_71240 [Nonomuraea roseoviolacea subsp. roseoviolacea]|uniref:hypothetical protein n=1 Tax=Nonomuraea roseoviolacea TaxID=103837 RepID=UPI0031D8D04F
MAALLTMGGRKPPSPPEAPTTPVALPTDAASTARPRIANTAPLPSPSAAAMARNPAVASGMPGANVAPVMPSTRPPASSAG